jgi:hypothetical protein
MSRNDMGGPSDKSAGFPAGSEFRRSAKSRSADLGVFRYQKVRQTPRLEWRSEALPWNCKEAPNHLIEDLSRYKSHSAASDGAH